MAFFLLCSELTRAQMHFLFPEFEFYWHSVKLENSVAICGEINCNLVYGNKKEEEENSKLRRSCGELHAWISSYLYLQFCLRL